MAKSYINLNIGLKKAINKMPDLVNLLKDKNKTFIVEFEKWLIETEQFLKKHNYSECSEMAGLRSRIYVITFDDSKRSSKKKKQMEVGAEIIYSAQNLIYNLIQPIEDKINESNELMDDLVAIAKESKMIKFEANQDFSNYIQSLWNYLKTHEQLSKYVIRINTLIGNTDSLRLFAEKLA